jgi:flagellar hook-length control protein FliK
MSNLAMANLSPAAAPRQTETATGKNSVAKKDTVSSKTTNVDVQQDVTAGKESVDTGILTSKNTKKFSFNDLLQKSLTKANADTSNDKSGTSQTKKQVIDTDELTSDNKTTGEKSKKQVTDNLVPVISFLPQALQPSKIHSVMPVRNDKSLQNLPLKAISSTKTGVVEDTKVVTDKEDTATKTTPKKSKGVLAVDPKEIKTAVEVKEMPIAAKTENTEKTGVSEQISNLSQSKQGAAQAGMNLSAETNMAGKDTSQTGRFHTQVQEATDVTKTEKSSLATPKKQTKAQVSSTTETSEVEKTVIASQPVDAVAPIAKPQVKTEIIAATEVTTSSTEKAAVGQAALTPAQQVVDKVQNTITGSTQQIQVTLTPEELGMIRLTFRQQEGQIEGLLEVQNPEVLKEVEKALPQITAALAQNGIQVRRMDITSMGDQQQPNQQSNQSPGHEFNPTDQHYLANNGDSGGSGGSGSGISGRGAQLADGMQDIARQTFDMSGVNMYA